MQRERCKPKEGEDMSDTHSRTVQSDTAHSKFRMILVGFAFLLQLSVAILFVLRFQEHIVWASGVLQLLALIVTFFIVGSDSNSAFKVTWLVFIGLTPVVGLIVYLLLGNPNAPRISKKAFNKNHRTLMQFLQRSNATLTQLDKTDKGIANQFRYLQKQASYPTYTHTDVQLYSDASDGLEAQLRDLDKAEHFIFMDYHAIEDGESFQRISRILARKAQQGVEVRLMYDDVGSVSFINRSFIKKMRSLGIQCKVFNPLLSFLNIFVNNRDHRKITVIDGRVGFTGGYNLANEYFNIDSPYGHWKDAGLRLEGDAVQSKFS